MGTARAASILLGKELRAELRTRELLNTTILFALIVVALFSFSFDPTAEESRRFGPGLLWIAFLFAGELLLFPSFAREQANDTLDALRMAPVDPFAIVLGKTLANLVFLCIAEAVLVPIFAVLYNVAILPVLGRLSLILALGVLGLSITGTVFSAVAAQARMRELLLPLLLLPVLTPLLIAATEATAGLLSDSPTLDTTWIAFLAGFDVVFLTASWLLCEHLVEE
ncbi:MAG: heme exporter protein CcmB [Candidatus Acidiferrales bacterium]